MILDDMDGTDFFITHGPEKSHDTVVICFINQSLH